MRQIRAWELNPAKCRLTLSPPIPLRLYILLYWSNPPFLIFDIRALWRSGLSARQSTRMSKIKNGGLDRYGAGPFEQQQFGTAGIEGVKPPTLKHTRGESQCQLDLTPQFRILIVTGVKICKQCLQTALASGWLWGIAPGPTVDFCDSPRTPWATAPPKWIFLAPSLQLNVIMVFFPTGAVIWWIKRKHAKYVV